jgi:hypothetical protein
LAGRGQGAGVDGFGDSKGEEESKCLKKIHPKKQFKCIFMMFVWRCRELEKREKRSRVVVEPCEWARAMLSKSDEAAASSNSTAIS